MHDDSSTDRARGSAGELELQSALPAFRRAFLERYLDDKLRGRRGSLEEYQARFPGLEELIAREYRSLEAQSEEAETAGEDDVAGAAGGFRVAHFRIVDEIGRGGQGVVYRAEDLRLGREVALKILHRSASLHPEAYLRFRREQAVISRLSHPGICPLFETGVDGGRAWFSMQFVRGLTLRDWITGARDGSLSAAGPAMGAPDWSPRTREGKEALVGFFASAARILHAAHDSGVVHRDINPQNIMITSEGKPVILDFGLALDEDNNLPHITSDGDVLGTLSYMSPEQLRGDPVDLRTDIWSLGVTFHECLTLRRPFDASTREAQAHAILTRSPGSIRQSNPAVSRDLEAVVEVMLKKDVNDRYHTCQSLADDLTAILEGRPISIKRASAAANAVRWIRREPAKAALAFAVILAWSLTGLLASRWDDVVRGRQQSRRERVEALLEEGYLHLETGVYERARESFDEARREMPESVEAVAGLALLHLEVDEPARASEVLEQVSAAIPVEDRLAMDWLRVDAFRTRGLEGQAERLEEHLSGRSPDDAIGFYILGQRQIRRAQDGTGDYRLALDLFSKALLYPDADRAIYYFGRAAAAGGCRDAAAAMETADILRSRWPESAHAWFYAALALGAVGRADSIAAYREALRLDPSLAVAWFNLGLLHKADGDLDLAIAAYRRAIDLRCDVAAFHNNLGNASRMAGRLDDAIRAYGRAIIHEPDSVFAYSNLGRCLREKGWYDKAALAFTKALTIDPRDADAHVGLGSCRRSQRRLAEAVTAFRTAIEYEPELVVAHYNLGNALLDQGDVDGAIAAWREAIRLDPGHAAAYNNLGLGLGRKGCWEEAFRAHSESIRLDPDNARAHNNLGLDCERSGRPEAAIAAFENAIRIDPEYSNAHINLGRALFRNGLYRKALEHLRGRDDGCDDPMHDHFDLLERCQRRVRKLDDDDAKLEGFRRGRWQPSDAAARAELADTAYRNGLHHIAARLYEEAFGRQPDLACGSAGRRFRAACSAAAAGQEELDAAAKDGARPSTSWSRRALSWLQEELEFWEEGYDSGRVRDGDLFATLRSWTTDRRLSAIRDEASVGRLPPRERDMARHLWADVDDLIEETAD